MSARLSRPKVLLAEVLLGVIPAAFLLLYGVFVLVFFVYQAMVGSSLVSDGQPWVTWFLLTVTLAGLVACSALLVVFCLRSRRFDLNTLPSWSKALLTLGLLLGQTAALAALLFLAWGGFEVSSWQWFLLLLFLLSPAVIAWRYLLLLRLSGGST